MLLPVASMEIAMGQKAGSKHFRSGLCREGASLGVSLESMLKIRQEVGAKQSNRKKRQNSSPPPYLKENNWNT